MKYKESLLYKVRLKAGTPLSDSQKIASGIYNVYRDTGHSILLEVSPGTGHNNDGEISSAPNFYWVSKFNILKKLSNSVMVDVLTKLPAGAKDQ